MPRLGQVVTNTFRATRGRRTYTPSGKLVYTPLVGWWKDATCKEVNCTHWERGWSIKLDFSPFQDTKDLLDAQGCHQWIVDSGRAFTNVWQGSECIYQFPPEQTCFRKHKYQSSGIPCSCTYRDRTNSSRWTTTSFTTSSTNRHIGRIKTSISDKDGEPKWLKNQG